MEEGVGGSEQTSVLNNLEKYQYFLSLASQVKLTQKRRFDYFLNLIFLQLLFANALSQLFSLAEPLRDQHKLSLNNDLQNQLMATKSFISLQRKIVLLQSVSKREGVPFIMLHDSVLISFSSITYFVD